jgi:hypothetical protein
MRAFGGTTKNTKSTKEEKRRGIKGREEDCPPGASAKAGAFGREFFDEE